MTQAQFPSQTHHMRSPAAESKWVCQATVPCGEGEKSWLQASGLNVVGAIMRAGIRDMGDDCNAVTTRTPCPTGPSASRWCEPATRCPRCKEGERGPIKKHVPICIWRKLKGWKEMALRLAFPGSPDA